eukprot:c7160_g1_i3.p1 GENE.c7160_g1_i3~~c7160_g1_i3.p1  ORF type:complete len:103 (+),score=16.35 c7160_g1_i3:100-408(+)
MAVGPNEREINKCLCGASPLSSSGLVLMHDKVDMSDLGKAIRECNLRSTCENTRVSVVPETLRGKLDSSPLPSLPRQWHKSRMPDASARGKPVWMTSWRCIA